MSQSISQHVFLDHLGKRFRRITKNDIILQESIIRPIEPIKHTPEKKIKEPFQPEIMNRVPVILYRLFPHGGRSLYLFSQVSQLVFCQIDVLAPDCQHDIIRPLPAFQAGLDNRHLIPDPGRKQV